MAITHTAVRNRNAKSSRQTITLAVSKARTELTRSRFLFCDLKDQIHILIADDLNIRIDHIEIIQLHDFAEAAFHRGLAVCVARVKSHFAANHLISRSRVARNIYTVNLGRQTFANLVFQVHNAVVHKFSSFIVLGKEITFFTISRNDSAASRFIGVIVKDFSAIQIDGSGKHLVRQDFIAGKVHRPCIIATAFIDININAYVLGSNHAVIRSQSAERLFHRITGQKLFVITIALMLFHQRIDFTIFPIAILRKILDPFLPEFFIRNDTVQNLDRRFFILHIVHRNSLRIRMEVRPVFAVVVRRLFLDSTRKTVHHIRRIRNRLVQLAKEQCQFAILGNDTSQIEVAARIRHIFRTVFLELRIQVTEMANRIQNRIAVRFKNRFLEFTIAPPVGTLRHHVVRNVRLRNMIIPRNHNRIHLDFRSFTDNKSHIVFMVRNRGFPKADFRQKISFTAVIIQNVLTVTFKTALAINASLQKADLQTDVFFRNFIATFNKNSIESRKFYDTEHKVHFVFITRLVIHPGGHVVKEAGFKKIRNALLHLFRKGRRLERLSGTNTHTTQHGAFIHIHKTFRTHITHRRRRRKILWHIQQLRHRRSGQN